MVSGQHDTWPISRWPRALALAIKSRSLKTAFGLVLLCSSAAIITGLPDCLAMSSKKGTGICPPLVTMYTPLLRSPIAVISAIISASLAKRDGMGRPPSPLCAGLVLLANPTAPAAIASRTMVCICSISSGVASRFDASAPITQVRTDECPM